MEGFLHTKFLSESIDFFFDLSAFVHIVTKGFSWEKLRTKSILEDFFDMQFAFSHPFYSQEFSDNKRKEVTIFTRPQYRGLLIWAGRRVEKFSIRFLIAYGKES